MTKHPKNRQCKICGKPSARILCGYCASNHCPTPEHHVAAERTCLRCEQGFESSWAGDRICSPCRQREVYAERDAIKRGHTPATFDSPYEPDGVPGIAE